MSATLHKGPPIRAVLNAFQAFQASEKVCDQMGASAVVEEYRALQKIRPTEALHILNSSRCGPPDILYLPFGFHEGVISLGASQPRDFMINESTARLCAKHCREMHQEGQRLEINRDHSGPPVGYVRNPFWAYSSGVRFLADWEPEGEALIIEGKCRHFSPTFLNADSGIYGLLANCGAIVSTERKPAFHLLRFTLCGTTKYKAMLRRAELFMDRIGAAEIEARRTHSEFDLLNAMKQVATEFPDLHAAHELREHFRNARAADLEAMS